MYYLVPIDGGGYKAGEILDLGDPEVAAGVERACGGLRVLGAEEATELIACRKLAAKPAPEPEPEVVAPVSAPDEPEPVPVLYVRAVPRKPKGNSK